MADRYIDVAYVDACMEQSVREALVGEGSHADLLIIIEGATSRVQSAMRNSGYAILSTQDPTLVDPLVKLAVMGRVWEMLALRPNNSLQLPDGWAESDYKLAMADILSGAAQLPLAQSSTNAPGGITVGSSTSRATDLSGW